MSHITIEIPEKWLAGLEWQPAMLEEVIQMGIEQVRIAKALRLYQAGGCSLGYAAEKFQIPKRRLIIEARARGIEPPFTETTIQEELGLVVSDEP